MDGDLNQMSVVSKSDDWGKAATLPRSQQGDETMSKQRKIAQPNYVRKLHYLYRIGALPRDVGLHQISVAHDGWCQHFQGRACDCDPDISLQWSSPAAAQN
jgi:hypothetical protein